MCSSVFGGEACCRLIVTMLADLLLPSSRVVSFFFFFQAEDGIRDVAVTGVQTCALPILGRQHRADRGGKIRGKRQLGRTFFTPSYVMPMPRTQDGSCHFFWLDLDAHAPSLRAYYLCRLCLCLTRANAKHEKATVRFPHGNRPGVRERQGCASGIYGFCWRYDSHRRG